MTTTSDAAAARETLAWMFKHGGPGPHDNGTKQAVHGGGGKKINGSINPPTAPKWVGQQWYDLINEVHVDQGMLENRQGFNAELKERASSLSLFSRVPGETLVKIIADTRMKSQHESRQSSGMYDSRARRALEIAMHAVDPKIDPRSSTIYGYVSSDPDGHAQAASRDGEFYDDPISQYGEIIIRMRPEVRSRTTITFGDSLDNSGIHRIGNFGLLDPDTGSLIMRDDNDKMMIKGFASFSPVPLDDPTHLALPRRTLMRDDLLASLETTGSLEDLSSGDYIEAQMHGGIGLSDMEQVTIPSHSDAATSEVTDALTAAGVAWRIVQTEDVFDEEADDWRSGEMETFENWAPGEPLPANYVLPETVRERANRIKGWLNTSGYTGQEFDVPGSPFTFRVVDKTFDYQAGGAPGVAGVATIEIEALHPDGSRMLTGEIIIDTALTEPIFVDMHEYVGADNALKDLRRQITRIMRDKSKSAVAKHGGASHDQRSHGRRGSAAALIRRGKEGGFTFHSRTATYPRKGFSVAVPGLGQIFDPPSDFTPAALQAFIDSHTARFAANDDLHLGGWYDRANNEMVLDIVEVFDDRDEAIVAGQQRDEQAIFDLENLEEISTGGTGGREVDGQTEVVKDRGGDPEGLGRDDRCPEGGVVGAHACGDGCTAGAAEVLKHGTKGEPGYPHPQRNSFFTPTIHRVTREFRASLNAERDTWPHRLPAYIEETKTGSYIALVRDDNNQIIGAGAFYDYRGDTYLNMLHVHNDHQGKGVGTAIMRSVARYVTSKGGTRKRSLAVVGALESAQSFYRRFSEINSIGGEDLERLAKHGQKGTSNYPHGQGNSVEFPGDLPWRPSMRRQEAEEWARGSAIPGVVTFVGRRRNIPIISEGGFHDPLRVDSMTYSRNRSAGSEWGDGIYLGTADLEADDDEYDADFSAAHDQWRAEWDKQVESAYAAGGFQEKIFARLDAWSAVNPEPLAPTSVNEPSIAMYGPMKNDYTFDEEGASLREVARAVNVKVNISNPATINISPHQYPNKRESYAQISDFTDNYDGDNAYGFDTNEANKVLRAMGYDALVITQYDDDRDPTRSDGQGFDSGTGGPQIIIWDPKRATIITDETPRYAAEIFKQMADRVRKHGQKGTPGYSALHPRSRSAALIPAVIGERARVNAITWMTERGFTADALYANTIAVLDRADTSSQTYGNAWYATAHEVAIDIHTHYPDTTIEQAAGVLAALSPRNTWHNPDSKSYRKSGNVADAYRAISAISRPISIKIDQAVADRAMSMYKEDVSHLVGTWVDSRTLTGLQRAAIDPRFKGMPDNVKKAARIASGENPDAVLGGSKVRSFYNNILDVDDSDSATIDSHQVRAMIGRIDLPDKVYEEVASNDARYEFFADVVRRVAVERNLPPHVVQAIVWEQWRLEHPASVREAANPSNIATARDVMIGDKMYVGPTSAKTPNNRKRKKP